MLNGSKTTNPNWEAMNLNSENFVAFNMTEGMQIIGGTWYGGEMKKGMFSMMNYLLPLKGMPSMHCSANVGENGDVAIFFGLSGTGKTTLSTDPKRRLIGDDEHGWDDDGIFNFEGGCYAKTINLSEEDEPDIYRAIRRDALLENVVVKDSGEVDYDDASKTENTRVSYPIYHIDNIVKPVSRAGHANRVIFLTADAFGVLPPVSSLTPEQAQYYFLSGFTAKLAGTERGVSPSRHRLFGLFRQGFPDPAPDAVRRRAAREDAANTAARPTWSTPAGTAAANAFRSRPPAPSSMRSRRLHRRRRNADAADVQPGRATQRWQAVDSGVLDPRSSYADVAEWEGKPGRKNWRRCSSRISISTPTPNTAAAWWRRSNPAAERPTPPGPRSR